MAKEIFISYSRKDFNKVKAIKEEIDCELGIDCWMDLDGIESGEQFKKVIINAINEHDTILFMLSANSMASPYALKELNFAASKKKRVILVFIESCQMTDDFLFDYQDYDNIDWNNALQHNKLMNNLRRWYKGISAKEKTLRELAEEGDPNAQYKLGESYRYGLGEFTKDEKEALKWYREAAYQGQSDAQRTLGDFYADDVDWTNAVKWYKLSAEQGDYMSQYMLGFYYSDILEMYGAPNYAEAIRWYEKSAAQDYEYAQMSLAWIYEHGKKDVPKNFNEAARWYVLASRQGNAKAIKWLKEHNITPYYN